MDLAGWETHGIVRTDSISRSRAGWYLEVRKGQGSQYRKSSHLFECWRERSGREGKTNGCKRGDTSRSCVWSWQRAGGGPSSVCSNRREVADAGRWHVLVASVEVPLGWLHFLFGKAGEVIAAGEAGGGAPGGRAERSLKLFSRPVGAGGGRISQSVCPMCGKGGLSPRNVLPCHLCGCRRQVSEAGKGGPQQSGVCPISGMGKEVGRLGRSHAVHGCQQGRGEHPRPCARP
jgi:hypothetical protein